MHLKFSQDIAVLLQRLEAHPLTLGDILSETSERGFSLMVGLLTLPFLSPIPLIGLNSIFGSASFLLSMQMAMGLRSPWLPQRIAQVQFPRGFIQPVLKVVQTITRFLEKITRPRLLKLATSHPIWQLNGLCMAWLTLLLMLPIPLPLTNMVPTVGILLFVVATLEADGLLMCFSYGLTLVITGLFGTLGYLLWQTPTLIQDFWQTLQHWL
ncbi:exopolysaccharide biosynthesis protein [Neosynechococcus sphagnicola sy1]|uniref:Exopolysaccharide biosynthesis protein n=1 Tax=Neosynechococcus sphagnicola sy1 TaxID=1497020 RepID=A0A098TN45_9CYAN|nr:exopolysaccharide biosynthesis protein [Neosynechococcus sphagnicola]KGF73719.1 exopolysaccharide biosynthesis protein [Neosynechococcus sphagnicola sy1]